jgi:PAS domain S-box-containing protein
MQAPDPPAVPPGADFIKQRFEQLIDSLEEYAVFMIDPTGTITSWNPGVERVLGYSQTDFVGLPFATLFTPEDRADGRPAEELQRAAATGRSDHKRERNIRRSRPYGKASSATGCWSTASRITPSFSSIPAAMSPAGPRPQNG